MSKKDIKKSSNDEIPDCAPKWGPWGPVGVRAVGWLAQQWRLMTGGGKRCWQQHVISRWNPASTLRLNSKPLICNFVPIWWKDMGQAAGAATYKTGAGVDPEVDLTVCGGCIRAMRSLPVWPYLSTSANTGYCYWVAGGHSPGIVLGIGLRVSVGVCVLLALCWCAVNVNQLPLCTCLQPDLKCWSCAQQRFLDYLYVFFFKPCV